MTPLDATIDVLAGWLVLAVAWLDLSAQAPPEASAAGLRAVQAESEEDFMSLPDEYLNEPPDERWCQEHASPIPCAACQADEADRQYDTMKEEQP